MKAQSLLIFIILIFSGCATTHYGAPFVTAPGDDNRYVIKHYIECEDGIDYCWYSHTTMDRYWQNSDGVVCRQDTQDQYSYCEGGILDELELEPIRFIKDIGDDADGTTNTGT